jgi:hypothetical protein
MHAEGHNPREIIKHFKDNNLPHPAVRNLYKILKNKCHQAEIESYKEDYYSRIKEVPISHKRVRLDVVQKAMNAIERTFATMLDNKGGIKTKSFNKCVGLIKRLNDMLTRAQDEMEKRPGTVVAIQQHFGGRNLTDEELLVEERNVNNRLKKLQGEGVSLTPRAEEPAPAPESPEDKG